MICLNSLIAAFSEYCALPFTVEEVEIFYESENRLDITPRLDKGKFITTVDYINCVGSINIDSKQAC